MSENDLVEIMARANQACEEGDIDAALHLYSESLNFEPNNALVYSNRSAAFLLAGDFKSSLQDAESAISLQPTWSKGYLRKGIALQHMRNFEGSISSLAQGLTFEPESKQLLTAVVDTLMLSQMKGTFESTHKQLRKIGLADNAFVMLSAIGQDLLSVGRFRTALSILKCAEQINTDNLRLKGSLMSALASAYWRLNNQKLAVSYMEEDLEICRSLGDEQGECRVMGNLGSAHYSLKQYDTAIQYHKDQLLLATELKSRKTAASALGCLGHNYSAIGEQEQALACHEQCVALAQEMDNRVTEALEYGNIGCLYLAMGQHSQALEYHEKHLHVAQELGDMLLQTKAYFNLAALYQQLQDYSEALKCYQEILTFAVKIRDRETEMKAYAGLGACTRHIGELKSSLNYYQQNLSIALKIPDRRAASKAYCCIGNVNQSLGCLEDALQAHKCHLIKVLELRDRVAEGRAYGNLGNVHCAIGHYTRAVKLHEQALSIAVEEGDTLSQASTNGNLGIAYQGLGELDKAIYHLDSHLTIARELQNEEAQIKALSNLGNFHANKRDFDTAHDLLQEQLDICKNRGDIEGESKSLMSTAVLYKLEGKMELAVKYAQNAVSVATKTPKLLIKNLVSLAKIYTLKGELSTARRTLERALNTLTNEQHGSYHSDGQHCEVLSELGDAHLRCGYIQQAISLFTELSDLAQEQQLPLYEMRSVAGQGRVSLACGHFPRAKDHLEAAISLCRDHSLRKEEITQQVCLSRVLCSLGEYEDAHSILESARELVQSREHPSQEHKTLEAEVSAGLGALSLAKGDVSDALHYFQTQTQLLLGEEQARENVHVVKCYWLLGDRQRAHKLLDTLDPANQRPEYLETRALLCRSVGRFQDEIHNHELRIDLARRDSDRVSEMRALCDSDAYLLEGHCDQALLHFDQALLISRDILHVQGECAALVGLAECYFHMSEYDTCLNRCLDVEERCQGKCSSVETMCKMHVLRARAHLAQGDAESCVKHARVCTEHASHHPILLATSTAILGQGLLMLGDKVAARESILSSCSQFEILLLQKNLDFVYEGVSGVQESSYTLLMDLEREKLWVQERWLRWERARYVSLTTPFPAHNTLDLADVASVMGQKGSCVVLRVDNAVLHSWIIRGSEKYGGSQPVVEYTRREISDTCDLLSSADVGQVLLGGVLDGDTTTVVYVVVSEEMVSRSLVDYFNLHADTYFALCGCLDDLSKYTKDRTEPVRSLTPTVFRGSHGNPLRNLSDVTANTTVTSPGGIPRSHMCHISAESLTFSEWTDPSVFVGDVSCEVVFVYNTGCAPFEHLNRVCLSLLSRVRCVILCTEAGVPRDWAEHTHMLLREGLSVFQSVAGSAHLLPDAVVCYGCDWLPRQPSHVAGVTLMLRSAADAMTGSVLRATLDILDKMETGLNWQGPLTVQYEVLEHILGWREVVWSIGGEVRGDTVTMGGVEERVTKEEVRTLITSLLDCGEQVSERIGSLLRETPPPDMEPLVAVLELYLETEESPLPFPGDSPHLDILAVLGLHSTGETVGGNALLRVERDASLLRLEAALFALKTLFQIGAAEYPYYCSHDDVEPIEI